MAENSGQKSRHAEPEIQKTLNEVAALWQEVQRHMEEDLHHHLSGMTPVLVKKDTKIGAAIRLQKEDEHNALLLKMILLQESIKACMTLKNDGHVYFAFAVLRLAFETVEDMLLLLHYEEENKTCREFIKLFYQEPYLIGDKAFYKSGPRRKHVREFIAQFKDPWEGEYNDGRMLSSLFSQFVHGQGAAIMEFLAGQENEKGGYTFGSHYGRNKNMPFLTKQIFEFAYISLCIFIWIRLEYGADKEYEEKSTHLRKRFKKAIREVWGQQEG